MIWLRNAWPVAALVVFALLLGCAPAPEAPEIVLPQVETGAMEPQVAAKIEAARQAVEERPGSASALGRLGMIYHAHALEEAALSCYRQAAELAAAEYRWPYLAALAQRTLDLEAAVPLFDQALERKPSNPAVHIHYGDLLLQLGRLDQAEEQYRQALAQDPDLSHALHGRAQVALARQDPAAAVELLERAVELAPSHGEAQALLARAYRQLGKSDEAERQLLLASAHPDATVPRDPVLEEMRAEAVSSRSYTQRGLRLVDQGRFVDAETAFRRVLEIRPGTARDLANLGGALARQQRYEEAIARYEQALELEPGDPLTANSLAMAHAETGRPELAIEQLERIVERDPAYAEARYNLGLLLDRRGEREAAIDHYREALRLDPALIDARNNLATALAATGQVDQAIETWRLALELAPDDLSLLYNLATALSGEGEHGQAIALLRRALRLAPNSSRIASALAWQLATAPDAELRDGAEAIRLARRIHDAYPNQPTSADLLAAALAEQGDFEQAVEVATQGLQQARKLGNAALAAELARRLAGYRLDQPYRQPSN